MNWIDNIIFVILLSVALTFFGRNVRRLYRNINLGRPQNRDDQMVKRWKTMFRVALGQGKMMVKPIPGILHIIVYVGFIIINMEMLEIIVDGIFGTHRAFSFMGGFYNFLIGTYEILALGVIIAVILFWARRNILRVARFWNPEMQGWPKRDGNLILYFELVLMGLFLTMNGSDLLIQQSMGGTIVGSYPVSGSIIAPALQGMEVSSLETIERMSWWLHIIGVLIFLNYLYYSKHLHILLAFPNTYYSKLEPKGELNDVESITKEVQLMLDPTADPYEAPAEGTETEHQRFGAKDATDLTWVQLMNAYTCTECGRCTQQCPANQTGKALSPRKIMMDTRDRIEEIGLKLEDGHFAGDEKSLVGDYITKEEIWACTSCNACTEACPVNIDPLSIIMELRRYLVLEESAAPQELNNMMTNIENNGAPWPYGVHSRLDWINEEI